MVKKIPGKYGGTIQNWEKGESGNPKGRPRKLVNKLKINGYTKNEINIMINKVSAMNKDELTDIVKNENSTILELGMAKLAHNLLSKGKTEFMDYVIPKKTSATVESTATVFSNELSDDPVTAANQYRDAMK